MDGPDLKPRANWYAWTPPVGFRSCGSDPTQPRSNPTRPSPIERHRAKGKKGWAALRRRRQHLWRRGSGLAGARRFRRSGDQSSTTSGHGASPRFGEHIKGEQKRPKRPWLRIDGEGRLGAADLLASTRSRRCWLPRTTRSGAKEPEKGGEAHQGLGVAGAAAESGRRRWPCGGGGGARGGWRCRGGRAL
jgi:hypothetical protein